jgi:glycosyltransferase involved in cell wall biosynthesis
MEPLVSVVIPLYNHEKFINTCLDSLYEEDYPNLEVILLDDGSRDRSFAMAQAWLEAHRDRFARIVAGTQANAGICRTYNRMIAQAQGRYIALMASDDAFQRGGLRARVQYLEQHPELLAVFGDAEAIDEHGATLAHSVIRELHRGDTAALAHPRRTAREVILRWSAPGSNFLARRIAYDPVSGVGPYNESLFTEDRDMYLRMLARKALGFVDMPVTRHRLHSRNASRYNIPPEMATVALRAEMLNLHRFRGLDHFLLSLIILMNQPDPPRMTLKYWLVRAGVRLARALNRRGWLDRF